MKARGTSLVELLGALAVLILIMGIGFVAVRNREDRALRYARFALNQTVAVALDAARLQEATCFLEIPLNGSSWHVVDLWERPVPDLEGKLPDFASFRRGWIGTEGRELDRVVRLRIGPEQLAEPLLLELVGPGQRKRCWGLRQDPRGMVVCRRLGPLDREARLRWLRE